ncbi:SHOCT domain-containing protein [Flavobacterium sp.]|jgi:hypothetical protein|uniref:SHOCT domain-containing protein n=1 Tax=Flavobacterium sp. TaxID=239 RepID=UPI0037BFF49B
MRTVIIKREYKSLLAFLIFISLFLIIRQNFANNIEVLYNKWTSIQFTNQSLPWVELEKLVSPYMLKIRDIERNFGFLIIFFSILIFSFLTTKLKSKNEKISLFFISSFLVFIITDIARGIEISIKEKDEYYLSLLIFLPFSYFIYKETIMGQKIDITEEIKNKANVNHDDNLKDLNKLLEMDLISQEEYNEKKELGTKEKIRIEMKDTEEYNLLLKSKEKGLLTEQEFNTKIENLISHKSQK